MAGQNRSSYARSNSANRGLAAFFRGAFILLVALTLSFGLGFFVIARMLPNTANGAGGSNSTGGGANGGASGASHSEHRAQSSAPSAPSSQIAAKPVSSAPPPQDGPVLLPDENVQKPDKLEVSGGNSSSSRDDAEATESTKSTNAHRGANSENDSAGNNTTASGTPGESGQTPGVKHSRRNRTPETETGDVQPASSPDTSPPVKSGIYRVQIGVYSTREKAEEVARSAADKGIATTLHIIIRDGRTLYRVQQSTHRDRTKAELDRQKLIDAGFDATIINPT